MTSFYSSQKRTRVHNQGELLEQKDFFGPLATLEPVSFGLTFSNKDSFNSIQKKKIRSCQWKVWSTSIDRGSADKASVLVDLHLGIHSFSFTL